MSTRHALLLLAALATNAPAEQAWITNHIDVGLYAEAAVSSPILKLLASGTPVDILERRERLARVRDADGLEGWIDTSYLMTTPGDSTDAVALRTQLSEAQDALQTARQRIAELQTELASAQTGADSGQGVADTSPLLALDAPPGSHTIDPDLAAAIIAGTASEQPAPPDPASSPATLQTGAAALPPGDTPGALSADLFNWNTPQTVIAITALLVGFIGGLMAYDSYHRRQHGGFRL